MKDILRRIPQPTSYEDSWQGFNLPPKYEMITAKAGTAWFVDGGNASIIEAPHFSLQKLRAAAVRLPDKEVKIIEDLCLITWSPHGWELYSEKGNVAGLVPGEMLEAITNARQQLEHKLAKQCDGLVVLDGDVCPQGCCSLQKSITVLTKNGFPLSSICTAAGPWCTSFDDIWAVKLHSRSRHVFLVHGADKEQLSILAHYSNDAVFPGYPYGLVLADKLARVSNEEQAALRLMAKAQMKELRSLQDAMASIDSHSILDNI